MFTQSARSLALLLALFTVGCALEEEPEHAERLEAGGLDEQCDGDCQEPAEPEETPSCEEGAQRDCKIMLAQQDRVKNCFVGVETCVDGAWSACLEPH